MRGPCDELQDGESLSVPSQPSSLSACLEEGAPWAPVGKPGLLPTSMRTPGLSPRCCLGCPAPLPPTPHADALRPPEALLLILSWKLLCPLWYRPLPPQSGLSLLPGFLNHCVASLAPAVKPSVSPSGRLCPLSLPFSDLTGLVCTFLT